MPLIGPFDRDREPAQLGGTEQSDTETVNVGSRRRNGRSGGSAPEHVQRYPYLLSSDMGEVLLHSQARNFAPLAAASVSESGFIRSRPNISFWIWIARSLYRSLGDRFWSGSRAVGAIIAGTGVQREALLASTPR